jgi:predicted nucleic acid-binding protein
VGRDRITVPVVVIAEWWRGPEKRRLLIREMFAVKLLDEVTARSAGEAIASLRRGTDVDAKLTIDSIVMASAARRGDVVYTSDVEDLQRFERFFPNVRIFSA